MLAARIGEFDAQPAHIGLIEHRQQAERGPRARKGDESGERVTPSP
jgi:hypothetical protein